MQPPAYTFDKVRLAALDDYRILDTPAETGFDDIVQLAAHICDAPVALVSFVGSDRQWFKARTGFDSCETDLNSSVCAHALVEPDLLIVPDLSRDPRTRDNPLVKDEPRIRFYAGAPLRTAEGHVLGSLCVIDTAPRPAGLNDKQAEMLRVLGRQVVSQLELRRAVTARERSLAEQHVQQLRRLASEAQFRALFEAIEDGFCVVEMKFEGDTAIDYRFVEVNPAFARQTGMVDAKGRWMRELAPAHEQHWFDLYGNVARTGMPARFEHFARELGGRWYDVHAFRIGTPEATSVAILFNDVSNRKAAELTRLKAEADQTTLNGELSHRMKNMFAMVLAIATQTLRPVTERASVTAFTQRIRSLSTAHDLLLQQNWTSAEIGEIVRGVVETLAPRQRIDGSGPKVALSARATLSVSLLLHELTTNALKHGALSNEHGRVDVSWRLQDRGGQHGFVLSWIESGGPAADHPGRKGLGSRLIESGLLGTGGVEMRYLPAGLQAEFTASLAEMQHA